MSSQYRSFSARRASDVRARRAAYHTGPLRRSDELAEAQREERGEPTLQALRGNLPPWRHIRALLTHQDQLGRGYYVAEETFGVVLRRVSDSPPENGEVVELKPIKPGEEELTYALFNIEPVGRRMFYVGGAERM